MSRDEEVTILEGFGSGMEFSGTEDAPQYAGDLMEYGAFGLANLFRMNLGRSLGMQNIGRQIAQVATAPHRAIAQGASQLGRQAERAVSGVGRQLERGVQRVANAPVRAAENFARSAQQASQGLNRATQAVTQGVGTLTSTAVRAALMPTVTLPAQMIRSAVGAGGGVVQDAMSNVLSSVPQMGTGEAAQESAALADQYGPEVQSPYYDAYAGQGVADVAAQEGIQNFRPQVGEAGSSGGREDFGYGPGVVPVTDSGVVQSIYDVPSYAEGVSQYAEGGYLPEEEYLSGFFDFLAPGVRALTPLAMQAAPIVAGVYGGPQAAMLTRALAPSVVQSLAMQGGGSPARGLAAGAWGSSGPGPAVSPTGLVGATSYVVKQNDTLGSIAARFRMSVADLLRLNPDIRNPNLIFPGQVIRMTAASPVVPGTTVVPAKQAGVLDYIPDAVLPDFLKKDKPGMVKELDDKVRGMTGFGLFPILAAGLVGYVGYRMIKKGRR